MNRFSDAQISALAESAPVKFCGTGGALLGTMLLGWRRRTGMGGIQAAALCARHPGGGRSRRRAPRTCARTSASNACVASGMGKKWTDAGRVGCLVEKKKKAEAASHPVGVHF